jgi:alkylation response protein AidB-like acyl-CoA dehydrogenase
VDVVAGRTLSGRKLWATSGTIAEIAVEMARVPKREGHRGGISRFVLRCDSEGITVEHRSTFMGIRGIENSALVPLEHRCGKGIVANVRGGDSQRERVP